MTLVKLKIFLSAPLKKKIKIALRKVKTIVLKSITLLFGGFAKLFLNSRLGREVLFSVIPKNQLLLAKTNENLYYIVNSSDKGIGKSVFRDQKSFDAHHLTNAINLIPDDKSILLDVGANIGTIGVLGVSKGYFKKCIAFEPEPHNFKLLHYNVLLNGLEDKFKLINQALSNETNGTLEFELSEVNYGDHRIRNKNTSGNYNEGDRKVISVPLNTLDSALIDENLDECVLFMDTQGFEGHILSGAKKLIQNNVPVVTEFWPYGLNRTNGLSLFYDVLSRSEYTSMWDLRKPQIKLKFSIDELKKIASGLGEDGDFTDLVFVKE
jgi:FkbM family methyltransferase